MATLSKLVLGRVLRRLNQRLVYADLDGMEFVVCGAASLLMSNPNPRRTQDVDILSFLHGSEPERKDHPQLPEAVEQVVADIGREFGIREDWLNLAAAPLVELGIPVGLLERAACVCYGSCLTVHFIHRVDEIGYKISAAMGRKGIAKHLGDLLDLAPTEKEARHAVHG